MALTSKGFNLIWDCCRASCESGNKHKISSRYLRKTRSWWFDSIGGTFEWRRELLAKIVKTIWKKNVHFSLFVTLHIVSRKTKSKTYNHRDMHNGAEFSLVFEVDVPYTPSKSFFLYDCLWKNNWKNILGVTQHVKKERSKAIVLRGMRFT